MSPHTIKWTVRFCIGLFCKYYYVAENPIVPVKGSFVELSGTMYKVHSVNQIINVDDKMYVLEVLIQD